MFYAINGKKKVPITYSNVYAQCPKCGVLHKVDLVDLMLETEGVLEDVQVLCEKCSRIHARQHRGEPWAEQILGEEV